MSNDAKVIRKQIRNIVQELLPELLKTEVFSGLYQQLQKDMNRQLKQLDSDVKQSLDKMHERSKDLQSFIMNQVQAELAKNSPPRSFIHDAIRDAEKDADAGLGPDTK